MSQCPFLFFLPDAFPIPLLLTSYSFPVRSLFNFHSFLFVSYSLFIHVLFISFSFSFVSFSFLYSLRNLPKCAKARIFFFYQSLIWKQFISSPKSIGKVGTPQIPKKDMNKGVGKKLGAWTANHSLLISYSSLIHFPFIPIHFLLPSYSFPIDSYSLPINFPLIPLHSSSSPIRFCSFYSQSFSKNDE